MRRCGDSASRLCGRGKAACGGSATRANLPIDQAPQSGRARQLHDNSRQLDTTPAEASEQSSERAFYLPDCPSGLAIKYRPPDADGAVRVPLKGLVDALEIFLRELNARRDFIQVHSLPAVGSVNCHLGNRERLMILNVFGEKPAQPEKKPHHEIAGLEFHEFVECAREGGENFLNDVKAEIFLRLPLLVLNRKGLREEARRRKHGDIHGDFGLHLYGEHATSPATDPIHDGLFRNSGGPEVGWPREAVREAADYAARSSERETTKHVEARTDSTTTTATTSDDTTPTSPEANGDRGTHDVPDEFSSALSYFPNMGLDLLSNLMSEASTPLQQTAAGAGTPRRPGRAPPMQPLHYGPAAAYPRGGRNESTSGRYRQYLAAPYFGREVQNAERERKRKAFAESLLDVRMVPQLKIKVDAGHPWLNYLQRELFASAGTMVEQRLLGILEHVGILSSSSIFGIFVPTLNTYWNSVETIHNLIKQDTALAKGYLGHLRAAMRQRSGVSSSPASRGGFGTGGPTSSPAESVPSSAASTLGLAADRRKRIRGLLLAEDDVEEKAESSESTVPLWAFLGEQWERQAKVDTFAIRKKPEASSDNSANMAAASTSPTTMGGQASVGADGESWFVHGAGIQDDLDAQEKSKTIDEDDVTPEEVASMSSTELFRVAEPRQRVTYHQIILDLRSWPRNSNLYHYPVTCRLLDVADRPAAPEGVPDDTPHEAASSSNEGQDAAASSTTHDAAQPRSGEPGEIATRAAGCHGFNSETSVHVYMVTADVGGIGREAAKQNQYMHTMVDRYLQTIAGETEEDRVIQDEAASPGTAMRRVVASALRKQKRRLRRFLWNELPEKKPGAELVQRQESPPSAVSRGRSISGTSAGMAVEDEGAAQPAHRRRSMSNPEVGSRGGPLDNIMSSGRLLDNERELRRYHERTSLLQNPAGMRAPSSPMGSHNIGYYHPREQGAPPFLVQDAYHGNVTAQVAGPSARLIGPTQDAPYPTRPWMQHAYGMDQVIPPRANVELLQRHDSSRRNGVGEPFSTQPQAHQHQHHGNFDAELRNPQRRAEEAEAEEAAMWQNEIRSFDFHNGFNVLQLHERKHVTTVKFGLNEVLDFVLRAVHLGLQELSLPFGLSVSLPRHTKSDQFLLRFGSKRRETVADLKQRRRSASEVEDEVTFYQHRLRIANIETLADLIRRHQLLFEFLSVRIPVLVSWKNMVEVEVLVDLHGVLVKPHPVLVRKFYGVDVGTSASSTPSSSSMNQEGGGASSGQSASSETPAAEGSDAFAEEAENLAVLQLFPCVTLKEMSFLNFEWIKSKIQSLVHENIEKVMQSVNRELHAFFFRL
ncbi:unnamed protein product [Amoebophrya sp. A25]|nr:unnamed protein product [Amoebophrya sp. A25]|eukprot:GSA25T00011382001.1